MPIQKPLFLISLLLFFISQSINCQVLKSVEAEKLIKGSKSVRINPKTRRIQFIDLRDDERSDEKDHGAWLGKALKISQKHSFKEVSSSSDQLGNTHSKYQLHYKNIPVEGEIYTVHSKSGKISSASGEYSTGNDINEKPVLTEPIAFSKAVKFVNATLYRWEKENSARPTGELVILPVGEKYILTYKFDIYALKPLSRHYVFIDANSGKILKTLNRIQDENVIGTAETMYSGTVNITTDSYSGHYRLRENGRGQGIETYDLNKAYDLTQAVDFTDDDNHWNTSTDFDKAAYDAHYGTEVTYDYYSQKFNRSSFDNLGAKLISYVHYNENYNNAFWDGNVMNYGDGDNIAYLAFTALEVVGHELAHALTQYSAGLIYEGESGALNESFSDIFGITIDFYKHPSTANYRMGDAMSLTNTAFRDLSNPNAYYDPDTYKGSYWDSKEEVHCNSGVQNFWYYLLCEGGSGTNDIGNSYHVTGIGRDKAIQIAYRNLTVYLSPNSDYSDARFYSIQSAKDLYGECSPEAASVSAAWYAVGIGDANDCYSPENFVAKQISRSVVTLSWTKNVSNNNVLIACSTSKNIGNPLNGTAYLPGVDIPGGGKVIYSGSSSSYNHSGIIAGTKFYYKAWSVKSGNSYSGGVSATVMPLSIVAGKDQVLVFPLGTKAHLSGSYKESIPYDSLSFAWEKIKGNGSVSFDHPDSLNTIASFGTVGKYTIQLRVSYFGLSSIDTMHVVVSLTDSISNIIFDGHHNWMGMDIQGNYAYLSDLVFGLRIVDIADIANPVALSLTDLFNNKWVHVEGDYAYISQNFGGGLAIYDIKNKLNPIRLGYYDIPNSTGNQDFILDNGIVYFSSIPEGLYILDVRKPDAPVKIALFPCRPMNMKKIDNYLYITERSQDGLEHPILIDVSDPANPVKLVEFQSFYSQYLAPDAIQGEYLYRCEANYGLESGHFYIYNISDRLNPERMGSANISWNDGTMAIQGNYAYLGDGLRIIDITDKSHPVEVSNAYIPSLNKVIVKKNIIYGSREADFVIYKSYLSNTPPYVYAGIDRGIDSVKSTLHGEIFDEGLPVGGAGSSTWSKNSGPGNVAFSDVRNLNSTVSFSDTGKYVLRLNATDGELSAYDEVQLNVHFAISDQPDSLAVCENTDAEFRIGVKSKTSVSYKWYKGNTPLNNVGNLSGTNTSRLLIHYASAQDEGNYWCRISNGKVFDSDNALLIIKRTNTPEISFNEGLLQSDAPSGNQWYLNNQPVQYAVNSTFIPQSEGDYFVIVTTNNCLSSKSNVINYITTGIEEQVTGKGIIVYPNPAGDFVKISINNKFGSDFTVDVYNKIGRLLKSVNKDKTENMFEIDLKDLPAGLYMLRLHNSDTQYRVKVIKQ
jgi:Zn-dependent metalloprotease